MEQGRRAGRVWVFGLWALGGLDIVLDQVWFCSFGLNFIGYKL